MAGRRLALRSMSVRESDRSWKVGVFSRLRMATDMRRACSLSFPTGLYTKHRGFRRFSE